MRYFILSFYIFVVKLFPIGTIWFFLPFQGRIFTFVRLTAPQCFFAKSFLVCCNSVSHPPPGTKEDRRRVATPQRPRFQYTSQGYCYLTKQCSIVPSISRCWNPQDKLFLLIHSIFSEERTRDTPHHWLMEKVTVTFPLPRASSQPVKSSILPIRV